MPKELPPVYTAPKTKFLTLWKEHKKTFETDTNKKKPSEKGFFGLYRKSAGIEPAFKLLDKVLADVPMPIPNAYLLKACGGSFHQFTFQISARANRQQKWVDNFNKAFDSFTKNCADYEKLLDKSADDDEYKTFKTNVNVLKAALRMLVKKATLCSAAAANLHNIVAKECDRVDTSNTHITAIAVEVKALNVMLKDFGVKPLLDETSATLEKDIVKANLSMKKAAEAKKDAAQKSSAQKKLADAKKKAGKVNDAIEVGTRFYGESNLRINESFTEFMGKIDS